MAKDDRESDDPQPFEEVFEGDERFEQAQLQTLLRVKRFQESPRFNDCPSPTLDVVDPRVVRAEIVVPGPTVEWPVYGPDKAQIGAYSLRVPERPHWADTDLTQAPGDWNPRRPDWPDVLVKRLPTAMRDSRERQVV